MLEWSLRHRFIMLVLAAVVSISAILLFPRIGKELVPDDDQSEFGVNVRLPKGTSFARSDEFVRDIEAEIKQLPEVQNMFTSVSTNRTEIWVGLTPLENRSISQQEIMRRARAMLRKYSSARISVTGGTDLSGASSTGGRGGGSTNRLYLLLQGREIDQLQVYITALIQKVRTVPGIVDVDTTFEATQPELRVNIDRARAADLGVTIDTLASSLRLLVGGEEVSKYKEGDDQYVVRLRLDEPFRRNPAGMGDLLVPSSTQGTVRVSDIAHLRLEPGPASIDRYNRQRQVSLFAGLDNLPLGEAIEAARAKVDELDLKPGYQAVFGMSARTFSEASNDFLIAIFLSVAFIYMVLASQFNSFVHPLTIMTALPLSLPAGLLTLLAFNRTINVYSTIGLMMLFGIVKKNSILQVDYTNTLRALGTERHEAMIQANHVRLRPILMTTLSIIAGMIPIAFGRGSGAGSRSSMALTIIGGQILCLLLTLLITPVVYSYFDDLREWKTSRLWAWLRRSRPGAAPPPPVTEELG
jgi:HAE1 family hydrophobic/amphiphilic exporter-1